MVSKKKKIYTVKHATKEMACIRKDRFVAIKLFPIDFEDDIRQFFVRERALSLQNMFAWVYIKFIISSSLQSTHDDSEDLTEASI